MVSESGDGVPSGQRLLLSVRGTSHRQTTDAGLREAMSLLNATLQSTADGILVMSSEGRVAGHNDQFLTMWGIPPELIKGDSEEAAMRMAVVQVRRGQGYKLIFPYAVQAAGQSVRAAVTNTRCGVVS